MQVQSVLYEWVHRRYWPVRQRYAQKISCGVAVDGDPVVPGKQLFNGWRRKWSWALVSVDPSFEMGELRYYPGYSLDGGYTFRQVVWPVRTRYFAFQIGPDPVMFSVFSANGAPLHVECRLRGSHLPWSKLHHCLYSPDQITLV